MSENERRGERSRERTTTPIRPITRTYNLFFGAIIPTYYPPTFGAGYAVQRGARGAFYGRTVGTGGIYLHGAPGSTLCAVPSIVASKFNRSSPARMSSEMQPTMPVRYLWRV
uniref:Uncharacterized protein n=1 Tax=Anopheles merus TaxID=30066 RepID=A0A182URB6_ANOME